MLMTLASAGALKIITLILSTCRYSRRLGCVLLGRCASYRVRLQTESAPHILSCPTYQTGAAKIGRTAPQRLLFFQLRVRSPSCSSQHPWIAMVNCSDSKARRLCCGLHPNTQDHIHLRLDLEALGLHCVDGIDEAEVGAYQGLDLEACGASLSLHGNKRVKPQNGRQ